MEVINFSYYNPKNMNFIKAGKNDREFVLLQTDMSQAFMKLICSFRNITATVTVFSTENG